MNWLHPEFGSILVYTGLEPGMTETGKLSPSLDDKHSVRDDTGSSTGRLKV
jgi:hypothetical protein